MLDDAESLRDEAVAAMRLARVISFQPDRLYLLELAADLRRQASQIEPEPSSWIGAELFDGPEN